MGEQILVIHDGRWKQKDVERALGKGPWEITSATPQDYETRLALDLPGGVVVQTTPDLAFARRIVEHIQSLDDALPVIVVVAKEGSMQAAVDLMKAGAYDVLVWPIDEARLLRVVEHAVHLFRLTQRVFLLEHQVGGWNGLFEGMLGHSTKMQELFQLIKTVAPSNATVLITGESGTGKELVARAIHQHSKRARQPFTDINCGAIPQHLLENELFGHEKGSYTGAERRYLGCCERSDKGSLFLDEICEMAPALQVKILRLLQERTFTRVGGTERLSADLRFIAATNRDIQKSVANGSFREDLYYRLNVVPIHLPPLRERPEDIAPLAFHFMEKFAQKIDRPFVDIAPDALHVLTNYPWPGNVRELENIIERVVVLHNDTRIKVKHLPISLQSDAQRRDRRRDLVPSFGDAKTVLPLEMVEKYAIQSALEKCVGNVSEAARRLKIGQATLYRKIKQFGLRN